MGEIRLVSEGIPDLLPMQGRSEGVHISTIIHSLCIKLGHYHEREDKDIPYTQYQLGSALEWAIIHRYQEDDPDRYFTPGELECDGLFGTPDLLDLEDLAIIECKLTWMSANQDPGGAKFWKYWVQGKAYAHMMGWDTVRVAVGHINGDYSFRKSKSGPSPIYRVWEQRCTPKELLMNWRMLQTHAEVHLT